MLPARDIISLAEQSQLRWLAATARVITEGTRYDEGVSGSAGVMPEEVRAALDDDPTTAFLWCLSLRSAG